MPRSGTPYDPAYDTAPSGEYPPDWQARREKVLERDQYTCQSCGVRSTRVDDVRFDVDHVVPKAEGGSHALGNLQTLCPSCHAEKHPRNETLRGRAREYERRNRPSLLTRVARTVRAALGLGRGQRDPAVVYDDAGRRLERTDLRTAAALPDGTGVTVDVTVTSLWSSDSDAVAQLGEVVDAGTDGVPVRFVVWSGNGHPQVASGRTYRLIGAKSGTYDGDPQLVVDTWSAIRPLG